MDSHAGLLHYGLACLWITFVDTDLLLILIFIKMICETRYYSRSRTTMGQIVVGKGITAFSSHLLVLLL